MLEAIARALDLDDAGRTHLHDLVDAAGAPRPRRRAAVQRVRPGLYQLLDALDAQPAMVLGRRTDVLATNRVARALFTDFERMPHRERNYARWLLLSDDARELFVDWEVQARNAIEALRLDAGRTPEDPETQQALGLLASWTAPGGGPAPVSGRALRSTADDGGTRRAPSARRGEDDGGARAEPALA